MNNKFIIFIRPDGSDISQQLKDIKKILSKDTKDSTDVQIIFQDTDPLRLISEITKTELNSIYEIQPSKDLFRIKSKIDQDKINYDRTFFLDKFSKSNGNLKLVINLVREGISQVTDQQSETIIIIGTKEFFKNEWPFDPKSIIFANIANMGLFSYDSQFFGQPPLEYPLTPIIIELTPKERIYF